jgi:hypothetical protein
MRLRLSEPSQLSTQGDELALIGALLDFTEEVQVRQTAELYLDPSVFALSFCCLGLVLLVGGKGALSRVWQECQTT